MSAGDWTSAQTHLEQGIALYDPQQHRSHAFLYGGHDPCVCCLGFAARCLWMLGYPDQALRRSREALALARELSHPTSLAHAQFYVGIFHQFRRDVLRDPGAGRGMPTTRRRAGASLLPGGRIGPAGLGAGRTRAWRRGACSDPPGAGCFGHEPALLARPFPCPAGRGVWQAGKVEEGLAALAEALRVVEDTGIGFYEPELHRLKGELLLARAPENPADAEACFRQAIAIARRQEAKSLELRAVMSLSRLYQSKAKQEEARPMLAEIYGWFTEGFDTADLQEAKALLQVIS